VIAALKRHGHRANGNALGQKRRTDERARRVAARGAARGAL